MMDNNPFHPFLALLLCFLLVSITPASAILSGSTTTSESSFKVDVDNDSFVTLNNIANKIYYDYNVKLSFTRLNKHSFLYDYQISAFQKDLLKKDGFLIVENKSGLYYYDIVDIDDKYQIFVLQDKDANTYIVERKDGYLKVKDYNGHKLTKLTPSFVGYVNSFHSKTDISKLLQCYLNHLNSCLHIAPVLNSTVTPPLNLNNSSNPVSFNDTIFSSNFLEIISPHLRLKFVKKNWDKITPEDMPIFKQNNDTYSVGVVQRKSDNDISVVLGDERFSRDYNRANFMKYYSGYCFVKYNVSCNTSNDTCVCNNTIFNQINETKSLLLDKLDFTALDYINYLTGELVKPNGIFHHPGFVFCTKMMLSMYLMTGIKLGMKQSSLTDVKSELNNHQSNFILIKNPSDNYNIVQIVGASETSTELILPDGHNQYGRGWRLDKELNYEGIYLYSDQPGPFTEAIYVCRANILNNTIKSPYTYESFKEAVNKWFSKWEHPWDSGLINDGVMMAINVMMLSAAVIGAVAVVAKAATWVAGFTAAGAAAASASGVALSAAAATGIGVVVVGGVLAAIAIGWGIWKLTDYIKMKKDVKRHVKSFKEKYFFKKEN